MDKKHEKERLHPMLHGHLDRKNQGKMGKKEPQGHLQHPDHHHKMAKHHHKEMNKHMSALHRMARHSHKAK